MNQLCSESFYVPAYQRGYRWTHRQVTDLLDDVFAFIEEKRSGKGEFYCLQPIVVSRRENAWELIDGQQRLTTLYLILSFFNSRFTEEGRFELFSIEYETRPGSQRYLEVLDESSSNDNIDFFHMHASYQTIQAWFRGKRAIINDIESAFLNHVKVIWYEVGHDTHPVDVFTRLNVGKIPLTNAELIKALFLRERNFNAEGSKRTQQLTQLKIAQEWDDMERRLQEDDFWYFLTNESEDSNRMELVLNLRAKELNDDATLRREKAYLFLAFNERMRDDTLNVIEEWSSVKNIFLLLDEWFKDRFFYHIIGFLVIQQGGVQSVTISRVRELAEESASKTEFRSKLKGEIFRRLFGEKLEALQDNPEKIHDVIRNFLADADYSINAAAVRNALLLFNLVSLLENEKANARFPFNFYKQECWDLEHIRSVKSGMPRRPDDQKKWANNVLDYLGDVASGDEALANDTSNRDGDGMCAKLRTVMSSEPFDSSAFEKVFEEVIEQYDPKSDYEADNSIGNLTLLDAATNRSYKNAIFPIKRRTLINLDKTGKFVPLCTKNAFLKYYSRHIDDMLIWTKDDSVAHQTAMQTALAAFFIAQGVRS